VDIKEYILHRLQVAGAGDREIFAPDTYPVIFKYTGGLPRLINTLCDTCLVCAFADNSTVVTMDTLNAAIEELQWLPYAKRINRKRSHPALPSENDASADRRDNMRAIMKIHEQLDKLNSTLAALPSISGRLIGIEATLNNIAAALRKDVPEAIGMRKKKI
jgi:hypothetical protein